MAASSAIQAPSTTTTSALLAPARSPRYESLDCWRGLVCFYILLEHVGVALWSSSGGGMGWDAWLRKAIVEPLHWNVGTPLFFVISGYCVASSVRSLQAKGGTPGQFLLRRFCRIFPPYWFALALFVIIVAGLDAVGLERWHRSDVSLELDSPTQIGLLRWLGNVTLTETWRANVIGPPSMVFTRIAWSLCYQEQFYVVCCLLLMAFPRRYFRAIFWASIGILATALVLCDIGWSPSFQGTFPFRWAEFAVGLVAYGRLHQMPSVRARRGVELGLAAAASVAFYWELKTTVAASVFALLLIGFHRFDARIVGSRLTAPLRAMGVRSYSIYLTHLPIAMVIMAALDAAGVRGFWPRAGLMLPLGVAGSLAFAWGFHRAIDCQFALLSRALSAPKAEQPTPVEFSRPEPRMGLVAKAG